MCYTIYLYHVMLIIALKPITTRIGLTQDYVLNFALQALLVVPIVIAPSALMFLLLEKPFMRRGWPTSLMAMLRGRAVPATGSA